MDQQSETTSAGCATCDDSRPMPSPTADPVYVYALGRVQPQFSNLGAQQEFAQVVARTDTAGKTDQQVFQAVVTARANRYLARQLCWVFTVQGIETYLLLPRDPADLELLLETVRKEPSGDDIDLVVGLRGPMASPEACNGLMVPIVGFDQIYSFDRNDLIEAIPRSDNTAAEEFGPAAEELFTRIMQLTDNAGATSEHRALNFLAMRYSAIYGKTVEQFARDFSLTGVEARPSPLSSTRNIVEVIFSFTNRSTDFTEKFFVRVDVTEEFPFLTSKLSPYFDR